MRLTATPGGTLRLAAGVALAAALLALVLLWVNGSFATLGFWASEQQRVFQTLLAERVRAVRAGDPAAFWGLIGFSAAYGFLHAAGPGHGKALVAGAALGTRAGAARMATIALAGSLAQALLAVVVVYGSLLLFQATARGTVAASEAWLALFGHVALALIGAWLMARGLLSLRRPHTHGGACGHAHGPDASRAASAASLREALALVGAMALRPCSGALVVLVIAWSLGIAAAGAAAVVAMGLGTSAITVAVALAAVGGRGAAFLSVGGGPVARYLAAGLQIGAGALVLSAGAMLLQETIG